MPVLNCGANDCNTHLWRRTADRHIVVSLRQRRHIYTLYHRIYLLSRLEGRNWYWMLPEEPPRGLCDDRQPQWESSQRRRLRSTGSASSWIDYHFIAIERTVSRYSLLVLCVTVGECRADRRHHYLLKATILLRSSHNPWLFYPLSNNTSLCPHSYLVSLIAIPSNLPISITPSLSSELELTRQEYTKQYQHEVLDSITTCSCRYPRGSQCVLHNNIGK